MSYIFSSASVSWHNVQYMSIQSICASGIFLEPSDASLLLKGHLWSVCVKLNQAAVSQRKVTLMVAVKEGETAAAGVPFMFSLQQALYIGGDRLKEMKGDVEK